MFNYGERYKEEIIIKDNNRKRGSSKTKGNKEKYQGNGKRYWRFWSEIPKN